MKIFSKLIMAALLLLITTAGFAEAAPLPAFKMPACSGINYLHGGYTMQINMPVQINDKVLMFKEVIKASYPKNYDLAVLVVVSDIDKNGIVSNPVEKVVPRNTKEEINGLSVWNVGIYPGYNGNKDYASFLVRTVLPAVYPRCVYKGIYDMRVGDSMGMSGLIINMKAVGFQPLTNFDVIDANGTQSIVNAKVNDEFDVKGLHFKVLAIGLQGPGTLPHAYARLEISKTDESISVKANKTASINIRPFGK